MSKSPELPALGPRLSFWHRTSRGFKHLNANSKSRVPSFSKYVVIGSGICGCLTAYSLISDGISPEDIVLVEAREAVSGASGRNAGHVRPDAFRGFSSYADLHGPEQALEIIKNEKLVLDRVRDFVEENRISCDLNVSTTFDINLTNEFAELQAKSYQGYRDAGGNVDHIKFYEGDEAKTRSRVDGAISAYEWEAASVHPAKLAQWLLSSVLDRGARLWTHCPVTSITPSSTSNWDIHTPRGTMASHTIVHCTNAYSGVLLPQMRNFVIPNIAQAHALVPNAALSGDNALTSTYSLRYSLHHFYSAIQRRGDGTIILGASRTNPTLSKKTRDASIGFNDRASNPEIEVDAIKSFGKAFSGFGQEECRGGEGFNYAWTGIIAKMADAVPCIGEVPGYANQWVCAGFNGHGMARIFTCAPGVSKLICGGRWEETGLPKCFQLTPERMAKVAGSVDHGPRL